MWVSRPWRSSARTSVGKVRARNEDAFLSRPERRLWAVADGMGGHQRGDIASQLIVNSLAELAQRGTFGQRIKAISQCLHRVNRQLSEEATVIAGQPDEIMGSTVVVLLVMGSRAACIWAGDSRCYLWRSQQLYQLSKDHSLQQTLIDKHRMSTEQAQAYPGASALTRAIGATSELDLSIVELELRPGDAFLLCSDGLYQGLGRDALGSALSLIVPRLSVERLFELAMRGSATDNFTAVVIRQ